MTSRRNRSAAAKTRWRSSPRARNSRTSSSSPSSPPMSSGSGVAADDERHFARLARRPRILPRQAERVRGPDHARQDGRVEPFGRAVPRVHRQPGRELEAAALGRSTEQLERRPRGFRVDVVDRHRRDAAPVVDPRVEQGGEVVRQVRGRLHRNLRRQDQPRCRNRPQELVERRLGRVGHPRSRLGPEVLDDHLLDLWTGRCDRRQRLESLLSRLADPDQDPGRERHPCLARRAAASRGAQRRKLVRRAEVRPAATSRAVPRRSRASSPSRRPRAAAARRSAASSTPGLRCGRSDVSARTAPAAAARYSSVERSRARPARRARPGSGARACHRA